MRLVTDREDPKTDTGRAVLLVEDDRALRVELGAHLAAEGFAVRAVAGLDEALRQASQDGWAPDAVVLDLLLPRREAYVVCRVLRLAYAVPVVLVGTAGPAGRGEADAVLPRPVVAADLAACLRELLRPVAAGAGSLTVGALTLLPWVGEARLGARAIALTADEAALLGALMVNAGRPVRRITLLAALRGVNRDVDPRVVDVHLVRLMVKLGDRDGVRLCHAGAADGYALLVGSRAERRSEETASWAHRR